MTKTPITVPTSMPPAPVVPMVRFPIAPAPVATTSGRRPAMKAKEVIWIGRKRSFAAFDGRVLQGHALQPPLDREFDDQDRVLAEQTDQHDQADLGVHVVGQTHGLQEEEGAEDPDRQRQDHRQRQDEALVLPDQHQIDEGDDDEEDIDRLVPLPCLVVSETRPADVETARQRLGADLLDRLDGLTGAVAGSRRALDGGGGVQVVPGDLVQALLLFDAS